MGEHLPNTVHKVFRAGYRIFLSCHRCGYGEELLAEAALSARDSMFDYHSWPCPTCKRATARAKLVPPLRELTGAEIAERDRLRSELRDADTIGARKRIEAALAPLELGYVPDKAQAHRETVRDQTQVLANIIAATGHRAGLAADAALSIRAEIVGLLIDYARAGDQARWGRLNGVPDLSPRELVEDTLSIALSVGVRDSELLAMAGRNSIKREQARFRVAAALATYLDEGFVFAARMTGRR